jgi:hypothetical protein
MSAVEQVIYTGPNRPDLGLPHNRIFLNRHEITSQAAELMKTDSAFANFFEDLAKFQQKPPPGSNAFAQAKIAQQPRVGRTLVHPPLRRHR